MSRAEWRVRESEGPAGAFHDRDVAPGTGREAWVHRVDRPALVLGSTQADGDVDREATDAAGIAVIRRRSGGGAVLVEPGGVVWVDLVVPPDDRLWDDDVGRAAHWVGETWVRALAVGGRDGAVAHRGGLVTTPWSRLVCFGGLGPGEVTIDGRKVVGVAQRRTRHGARFQCAALLRWDPDALVGLLALDEATAADAAADLASRAAPAASDGDALVAALLASLPT